jgi:outer membrane protein assembly factor BamB
LVEQGLFCFLFNTIILRKIKMQKTKNKTMTISIAILLMISMVGSMMLIPSTNAHSPPWTISTYAYIVVSPNPVGVGQTAYVNFWIDKVPPASIGSWGVMWHNFKVTVTDPSGQTKDLGTFSSDAAGGAWTQFVPDQVGTYTFNFNFPGQTAILENPYPYNLPYLTYITYDYLNDTYTESSASTTLTVQEESIKTAFGSNPLPTEYWTRPISSMNRDWSVIGGNWFGLGVVTFGNGGQYNNNGNFNAYTQAPSSAHVLWTKPEAFGGQIGGEFGPDETSLYATGTAYETKFGPVIINGVLYYTQYPGAATNLGPLTAVDIRTGETLWTANATNPLRAGMVYNFKTGDQYGGHAYLFTGPASFGQGFIYGATPNVWSMYDAMTGQWVLDIANVTEGTLVEGQNGEILSYTVGYDGTLSLWNVSKCIGEGAGKIYYFANYSPNEIWRPPQGATIDWNDGYEWTVPIATNISGKPIGAGGLAMSRVSDDVVLLSASFGLGNGGVPGGAQTGWRVDAGYSAIDGHLLWGPVNRTLTPYTNTPLGPAGEGVYTEYTCQSMTWTGYDLKTGNKLWGPSKPYNSSWGYYDNEAKGVIGYGNLYVWGMSGEVFAFDVKTGTMKWSWSAGGAGVDTPFGVWPLGTWAMQHILADGKIYVSAGHDYTPPVFKGAKLYCINATTGEKVWDSLNFDIISSPAVSDGIMVWLNGYDNQIYAYGKGPSAMNVEAQKFDSAIVIRGSVIDKSAGTQQASPVANFPNGVPCVSEQSMSRFMESVYQQQPMPTTTTGVPVSISVLDSNGNYRQIGTTTSDGSGMFTFTWKPDIPGDFTVVANFAGSESYYSSYAETSFYVDSPAPTASPYPTVNLPPTEMYFAISTVAIIIAIAIVGFLMLRKRP